MQWPKIITAWLKRRGGEVDTAGVPGHTVFVLNALIDMPTSYATKPYAGSSDAELYFLDYNYLNQAKTSACFSALASARATHQLDFSSKTLLLAAKGLHPANTELIELMREFRVHHVFFELWNGLKELVLLANAGPEHLYFLPVAARLGGRSNARVPARPNRRVFVSLGGDDDLDLIRAVIARCPQLQFSLPDVSWAKPGSDKHFFDVQIRAANVTAVDCSTVRRDRQLSFSAQYRAAYEACDTVLIATAADKMFQMRGGVRLADALQARKHIVMTENPLCQLVMGQHEQTCLVAPHDAAAVSEQLTRICDGGFQVVESTYDAVRQLTAEENKLPWMLEAVADPATARRSVFARGQDLLEVTRRSLFARGRDLLEREVREVAGHQATGRRGAEPLARHSS